MPVSYDQVIVISLLHHEALAEYRAHSRANVSAMYETHPLPMGGTVAVYNSQPKPGSLSPAGLPPASTDIIPYFEFSFQDTQQIEAATAEGIDLLSTLTPNSKLLIVAHGNRGVDHFRCASGERVPVSMLANLIHASFRRANIRPPFSQRTPLKITLFSSMAADWGDTDASSQSLAGRLVESLAWNTLQQRLMRPPYIYAQVSAPWTATTGSMAHHNGRWSHLHLPRGVTFARVNDVITPATIMADMHTAGLRLSPAEGIGSKLVFALNERNDLCVYDAYHPGIPEPELIAINRKKDTLCCALVDTMVSLNGQANPAAVQLRAACDTARALVASSTNSAELDHAVQNSIEQSVAFRTHLRDGNLIALNRALQTNGYNPLPPPPPP